MGRWTVTLSSHRGISVETGQMCSRREFGGRARDKVEGREEVANNRGCEDVC